MSFVRIIFFPTERTSKSNGSFPQSLKHIKNIFICQDTPNWRENHIKRCRENPQHLWLVPHISGCKASSPTESHPPVRQKPMSTPGFVSTLFGETHTKTNKEGSEKGSKRSNSFRTALTNPMTDWIHSLTRLTGDDRDASHNASNMKEQCNAKTGVITPPTRLLYNPMFALLYIYTYASRIWCLVEPE